MPRHIYERGPRSAVPEPRAVLLRAVLEFVKASRNSPGVQRIALIGSLTTPKKVPKDADVLVTIAPDLDLTALARLGRSLKGRTQQINLGADVFLAEPDGRYIGRTCAYRECHPRVACGGHGCGLVRPYLKNDLDVVKLKAELVRSPPVELWPRVVRRSIVPADVQALLLAPLEGRAEPVQDGETSGADPVVASQPAPPGIIGEDGLLAELLALMAYVDGFPKGKLREEALNAINDMADTLEQHQIWPGDVAHAREFVEKARAGPARRRRRSKPEAADD